MAPKTWIPLLQREWLQHRFGWSLMLFIPLTLSWVLSAFGGVEIDGDSLPRPGTDGALPMLITLASVAVTAALLGLIAAVSSIILTFGLPRRDHADRSVEFWLSMPVGHAPSMLVPMLAHLLLVPAAALVAGALGGLVVSLLVSTQLVGAQAWLAQPWGLLLPALLAGVLRVLAGLPLAVLWLSPIVLTVMLATAWFKRWGLIIVAVGVGLISLVLQRVFGQPLLLDALGSLLRHARMSLVGAGAPELTVQSAEQAEAALRALPGMAWTDFVHALALLASPLLLGGLVLAGACFALLLDWRRRGAPAG